MYFGIDLGKWINELSQVLDKHSNYPPILALFIAFFQQPHSYTLPPSCLPLSCLFTSFCIPTTTFPHINIFYFHPSHPYLSLSFISQPNILNDPHICLPSSISPTSLPTLFLIFVPSSSLVFTILFSLSIIISPISTTSLILHLSFLHPSYPPFSSSIHHPRCLSP